MPFLDSHGIGKAPSKVDVEKYDYTSFLLTSLDVEKFYGAPKTAFDITEQTIGNLAEYRSRIYNQNFIKEIGTDLYFASLWCKVTSWDSWSRNRIFMTFSLSDPKNVVPIAITKLYSGTDTDFTHAVSGSNGTLYLVTTGKKIVKYDKNLKKLGEFTLTPAANVKYIYEDNKKLVVILADSARIYCTVVDIETDKEIKTFSIDSSAVPFKDSGSSCLAKSNGDKLYFRTKDNCIAEVKCPRESDTSFSELKSWGTNGPTPDMDRGFNVNKRFLSIGTAIYDLNTMKQINNVGQQWADYVGDSFSDTFYFTSRSGIARSGTSIFAKTELAAKDAECMFCLNKEKSLIFSDDGSRIHLLKHQLQKGNK